MEKGLAIIEVNDTEVKGIRIDQEALEFARQNAKTRKRLAKTERENRQAMRKNAELQAEAERKKRKVEQAEARRRAYTARTVKSILIHCGIVGAVTWAMTAGLIAPIISIPVTVFCLCAACLRLGLWFGKRGK